MAAPRATTSTKAKPQTFPRLMALARIVVLVLAFSGLTGLSKATVIHVCPTCTYTTIQDALANQTTPFGPGVTIEVQAGTYGITASGLGSGLLTIGTGGASGSPAVLKAVGGEVIIDCTLDYSNPSLWTVHTSSVYKASLATPHVSATDPASSQLFVNDVPYTFVTDTTYTTLSEGSYAYDRTSGSIYAHVTGGGNPGSQQTRISDFHRNSGILVKNSTGSVAYLTIDGFTIRRSAIKGIEVDGNPTTGRFNSITVQNCIAKENRSQGISYKNTTNGLITNNHTHHNVSYGIELQLSDNCHITGNESFANANPDAFRSGIVGIEIGNDATDTTSVSEVWVDNNVVYGNEDSGIELRGAEQVLVRRNISYGNGDHGFDNTGVRRVAYINNIALKNDHDGLSIENRSDRGPGKAPTAGSMFMQVYNNILAYNARNSATLASPPENIRELWVGCDTAFSSNYNVIVGLPYQATGGSPVTGYRYLIAWRNDDAQNSITFYKHNEFAAYQTARGQDLYSYNTFPAFNDTLYATVPVPGDTTHTYDFTIRDDAGSDNVIDAALTTISGWTSPMWLSVDPHGIPPHNAAAINQGSGAYVYGDIGAYELDPRPRAVTSADDSIFAECVPGIEGQWRLNWKAVSDDSVSNGGPVAEYLVKYLDSSITEANWASADSLGGPFPLSPGSWQGFYVQVGSTKHVRLKDKDSIGQWSGLSPELTIDAYPAGNCGGTWYVGGGGGGGGGGHEEGLRGPTLTSLQRLGSSPDLVGTGENTILNGIPSGTRGVDLVPIKAVQNDEGAYVAHVRVTDRYGTLVDGLKMLIVDHPVGTEAFACGSTVVSGRRSQASQAVTEAGEDVTKLLNGTGGIFNAAAAVAVTVSTPLDASETPLVIECANGGMRGNAIIVESQTPSGWREVGVVYPRRVSSACVIDAVPPGPVRLRFTGYAYLSSIARLARETTGVSNTWGTLESALSSSGGDVASAVATEDTVTTALVGPDTLVAVFAGPALSDGAVRSAFLGISATPVTASAARSAAAQRASSIPTRFALYQNVPNPFRGSTTFRLDLPVGRMVRLEIFDVSGRRVRTLVNHFMPAGRQSVAWNQRDDSGAELGAGVYFARVQADSFRDRKKLILMP